MQRSPPGPTREGVAPSCSAWNDIHPSVLPPRTTVTLRGWLGSSKSPRDLSTLIVAPALKHAPSRNSNWQPLERATWVRTTELWWIDKKGFINWRGEILVLMFKPTKPFMRSNAWITSLNIWNSFAKLLVQQCSRYLSIKLVALPHQTGGAKRQTVKKTLEVLKIRRKKTDLVSWSIVVD